MLTIVSGSIILPELILRSTVSIASSLITSANYLVSISKNDFELQKILIESDIIEDISILKHFIEEKETQNHSNTVSNCIQNLNKTMKELEENISSITSKIENHKNLWFGLVRSYNIYEEKKQIPILITQLKHRFEILIKISSSLKN